MRIPVLQMAAVLALLATPVLGEGDISKLIGDLFPFKALTQFLVDSLIYFPRERSLIPLAVRIDEFQPDDPVVKDLAFHAKMSHTTNCRSSMENWDCPECERLIPDGVTVTSFDSRSFAVSGQIVKSAANKVIYVLLQGATSIPNKLEAQITNLIEHPNIPNAHVQMGTWIAYNEVRQLVFNTVSDQLKLHPTYQVHVVGHSFGASLGSLAVVDLFSRLPHIKSKNIVGYLYGKPRVGDANYAKFVQDHNIDIRRVVYQWDKVPHAPAYLKGYRNEGVEYWQYNDSFHTRRCIGPKDSPETRSCSNEAVAVSDTQHLVYYGEYLGC